MRIDVEVDGVAVFERGVERISRRADNLRDALEMVADDWADMVDREFDSAGSSSGAKWRRNAPVWAAEKKRTGRGEKVLQLEGGMGGRLRESLAGRGSWGTRNVSDDRVVVGTRLGIANTLRRGGSNRTTSGQLVTMDARPFGRVRRADRERWMSMVREHLLEGQSSAGGGFARRGFRIGL